MDTKSLKPQERVFRWWDAGFEMTQQPLTVIRVNRKTVTVRTDQGSIFRISPDRLDGYVTWE